MYAISSGRIVSQYTLSTPWDLSTSAFDTSSPEVGSSTTQGMYISPDGTKLFVNNYTTVFQYTLLTPWDVSTASYDNISLFTGSQDSSPQGIYYNGSNLYISGSGADTVYQYE